MCFLSIAALTFGLGHDSAHAAAASLPNYFTRVWRTEDGLPQNIITAVVQTHEGYLWVGTYDGLARFDGDTFTVFDSTQMRNSRVISLFEDSDGTLWIAHETGELTRYRDGRFEAVGYRAPWENRKIVGVGSDETGKLWLLNEEGRLSAMTGEMISAPNAGTATKFASLARNEHGKLWVAYAGEVFALTNNQLVSLAPNEEILGGYVTGICTARDGGLWLVSGGRIRKWKDGALTQDLGPSPWDQGSITTALEGSAGDLVFGTLDGGLYLVAPGRGVMHFDRSNGFPNDWIRAVFEDREGTLWVGTGNGGLVALRAGKVKTVDPPDHWRERTLLSVSSAHDGALWVGTEGAGLYRFSGDTWTRFAENSFSNLFVWSVAEDKHGRVWAGTWGGGLLVWNGDRFEPPAGLEDFAVPTPAILHGRNGVTWLGTAAGLVRYADGKTTWFGRNEGLTLPDVRAVVEDHDGGIWFGMIGGGLGRLRNGTLEQFHRQAGLASEYVQCLRLDSDGTLWIGTHGGGLSRLKNGRFASIGTGEGLPNNFICDIEDDDRGNFWFSSHGGIFRIEKQELNRCADGIVKSVQCLTYGRDDGMPSLQCSGGLQPAGCKTSDGRIWFPTSKGLVVVDPGDAKFNQLPPPVVIEGMLVDGVRVSERSDVRTPLQISPGRHRFEFRFAALTFVAPEKVRFRYRIEGLEPEWNESAKRTANYVYVPPGPFVFHVIACNSDGEWNNTGAQIAFVVQPYLWQRLWFRALVALAAACALAGAVALIARRRMRWKLERLERQQAIERERSRIAQDIHDNLGASLTRISLLSQSAYSELDNPQHTATQLDRIYNTARELTRAMDEIVWAVNPQHDTLDSLASYLGKFAQDFLGPINIRCRLDLPVHLPTWPLTAEVRHNLFLAFKEALHNVVKHAAASEVLVSLTTQAQAFTLAIRDNGKGFKPRNPAAPTDNSASRFEQGNGLNNMRKRLEQIGGQFAIESTPGQGTEVRFVVPATAHVTVETVTKSDDTRFPERSG